MPTLLLRLAGPLQSWGTQSRFTNRDTGREPSKSGVIGLLCAALGIDRSDDCGLQRLAYLTMGVRVDREGRIARDFHTAGGGEWPGRRSYGVITAKGDSGGTVISDRFYLADAEFLVGLEGDADLLADCQRALAAPRWPLYLGRKSFVPGVPVRLPDGLREEPLEMALSEYSRRCWSKCPGPGQPARVVLESRERTSQARFDQPLSFRQEARQLGEAFALRYLVAEPRYVTPPCLGGEQA